MGTPQGPVGQMPGGMQQAPGGPQPAPGNQGSSKGPVWALAAVALVAVLGIVGATWMIFGGSSDEAVPVTDTTVDGENNETDNGDGGDEVGGPVPTDADFETCAESKYLSLPGTDITIEPVTYDDEVEFTEQHRAELEAAIDLSPKDDPESQQILDDLLEELKPADVDTPYTVTLIENEMVNAFIIPGGEIFVTDSLMDLMTEDELAFVFGHELSHGLCRHTAQQMERLELVDKGAEAATDLFGIEVDPEEEEQITQTVFTLGNLSFSREDEYEADAMAIVLMRHTDRPLEAAVSGLQKLADLPNESGQPTIEILSTHPITENRIKAVEYDIENG